MIVSIVPSTITMCVCVQLLVLLFEDLKSPALAINQFQKSQNLVSCMNQSEYLRYDGNIQ